MNTPAHLLIGWAAFGRGNDRKIAAAAVFGALLPDLSLYLMAGTSIFLMGISPREVFNELYFSPAWQAVFSVDNSFFVWGAGLAAGFWLRKRWLVALCGAALLHVALDFPLHHDDGRAHFWPLSNWIFESPVSYWDVHHHAGIVGPIEAGLAALCALMICLPNWRRLSTVGALVLMVMEIYVVLPGFWLTLGGT